MGLLRIFIACVDERLRLALLLFLDHQPGLVVAGMADRLPGLLAQLEGSQPGVLLLEWKLLGEAKIEELLTKIHSLESRPKIIILADKFEERETVLAAGADYFMCKNSPPDELLPILNDIRSSNTYQPENNDAQQNTS